MDGCKGWARGKKSAETRKVDVDGDVSRDGDRDRDRDETEG